MRNKKILLANSLLLLALLLFILVPNIVNELFGLNGHISDNITLLLTGAASVIALGGIALLYCLITKRKFKNVMVIKKISIKQVYLTIFVAFGTYIFAVGINSISMKLFPVTLKDSTQISNLLNGSNTLLGLLVVVLLPAFFEEIFFRGIFLDAYEGLKNKKIKYIILTLIFATFHGNVMQIIYVMFLGFILLLVREYTGSIVGSMTLHAANNAISFIISKVAMNYMNAGVGEKVAKSAQVMNVSNMTVLLQASIFFLIGGAILYTNLTKLKEYKDVENKVKVIKQEETNDNLKYIARDEEHTVIDGEKRGSKVIDSTKYIPLAIYFVSMVVIVVSRY